MSQWIRALLALTGFGEWAATEAPGGARQAAITAGRLAANVVALAAGLGSAWVASGVAITMRSMGGGCVQNLVHLGLPPGTPRAIELASIALTGLAVGVLVRRTLLSLLPDQTSRPALPGRPDRPRRA